MPIIVKFAFIYFTLALLFYSIGIWGERIKRIPKPWYLVFFWSGLIANNAGTHYGSEQVGGIWILNFHTITGVLGLLSMAVHSIWATYIILKNNPKWSTTFHRFGLSVWPIWSISYFTGFFSRMTR